MKILVVGGGGREHAIISALCRGRHRPEIFCAPGNAGIADFATCVDIGVMDFAALRDFAEKQGIDLTIVGMDDPLAGGIVDYFEEKGLKIFGPRKNAAVIESSKAFAKDLMLKYDIPCAGSRTFTDAMAAKRYLKESEYPVVLKADGLALGKGVLICRTPSEALDGVREIMEERAFGDAGSKMVIEEFLTGREVSILSFVDGKTIRVMSSAMDYKRAGDGDTGPNTGGMGNISPSPFYTEEIDRLCRETIYQRTVDALRAEGREFKGVIFFGLMLTPSGPKVLEYNARFGDPEAQVVLTRMKSDLIDLCEACIEGRLDEVPVEFEDEAAVCVILASGGYPVQYEKGKVIRGLERFKGKERDGYFCFHSGTKRSREGEYLTNGGRVLGVTAMAKTLTQARDKAYEATKWISFDNMYLRQDIGKTIDEAKKE